jgi:hypothetical protein
MKVDETLHGSGLSGIPGEFRENYNFLSELIRCRDENSSAGLTLQHLLATGSNRSDPAEGGRRMGNRKKPVAESPRLVREDILGKDCRGRSALTGRQQKILKDFLRHVAEDGLEEYEPPVPAELEASIRIRERSTWLPWEAEAIRKIERWRKDVCIIAARLQGTISLPKRRKPAPRKPRQS